MAPYVIEETEAIAYRRQFSRLPHEGAWAEPQWPVGRHGHTTRPSLTCTMIARAPSDRGRLPPSGRGTQGLAWLLAVCLLEQYVCVPLHGCCSDALASQRCVCTGPAVLSGRLALLLLSAEGGILSSLVHKGRERVGRDAAPARCAQLAARRHGVHKTGDSVLHEADSLQAGVAPPRCRSPCSSWMARQVQRSRRRQWAARSARRIRSALSAAAQPGDRARRSELAHLDDRRKRPMGRERHEEGQGDALR